MKTNSSATSGGLSGLGSTDNAVLRADGTGGSTAQGSSVVITDAGAVSGVTSLAMTAGISGATTIGASGAVTLTAATGNSLVVDTTTLVVDATNNRVGVGTASPTRAIDLVEAAATTAVHIGIKNGSSGTTASDGFIIGLDNSATPKVEYVNFENSAMEWKNNNAGSAQMILSAAGNLSVANFTASRAMTCDSSKNLTVSATTDTELGYVSGVTSPLQTQLNAINARATRGWPIGAETTSGINLNDEAYYAIVVAAAGATITGVEVYVSAVGGDPTKMRIALYDSAGTTRHAVRTTDATVSAVGGFKVAFDATYTITDTSVYWVGIYGDASNSTFLGSLSSVNATSSNRYVVTAGGVGATLPAGTATATRLCFNLY